LPVSASVHLEGPADVQTKVCGACGYSLRGIASDRCPECGASTAGATRAEPGWQKALHWLSSDPTPCPRCGEPMLAVDHGACRSCGLGMPPPPGPERPSSAANPKEPERTPTCARCGYDLRGLAGRRCPECGAPISRRQRGDAPMSAMPVPFVRLMRTRLALAAALVVAPVVVAIALNLGASIGSSGFVTTTGCIGATLGFLAAPLVPGSSIAAIGAAIYAIGLAVATWLVTPTLEEPAAQANGFAPHDRMRRLARFGAVVWLATPIFAAPMAIKGTASRTTTALLLVSVGFGLLALAPASFHLRSLAWWMRDDRADRYLGASGSCALFAPLLPVLVLGLGQNLATLLLFVLVPIAACTAFYGFAYGLLLLAMSSIHCVHHASDAIDRIERRAERFAERERESAAMVRALDDGAPTAKGAPGAPGARTARRAR
jgi:ribosomal protein L37E